MGTTYYPERLARLVLRRLRTLVAKGRLDPGLQILSQGELTEILDVAYLASMTTEEQRPIRFIIGIDVPQHITRNATYLETLSSARLVDPVRFGVETIRRLAPAIEAGNSVAVVDRPAQAGANQSWQVGRILPLGRYEWDFLFGRESALQELKKSLLVCVRGPGELLVAVGETLIAHCKHGKIVHRAETIWVSGPLRNWFQPSIDAQWVTARRKKKADRLPDTAAAKALLASWVVSSLELLLEIMFELRHGGTLLFIRKNRGSRVPLRDFGISLKYLNRSPYVRLREACCAVALAEHQAKRLAKRYKALPKVNTHQWGNYALSMAGGTHSVGAHLEAARFVASLSVVDGAVLLDDSLSVLGWGGEIDSSGDREKLPEFARVCPSGRGTRGSANMAMMGTRHRSAARFVAANRDSLALVVSQDGGARLLVNSGGTLELIDNVWGRDWTT